MVAPLATEPLAGDALGDPPARSARVQAWARAHRWELALWAIGIAAGIGLRWWLLGSALGGADLDEATVALQAGRFRDGQVQAFFPNQGYGGTVETALVALSTQVLGANDVALKLVPMALALVAAALTRQIAVALDLSRTAIWTVPLLVWCGPAYAVLFSTKERGFYGVALVLAAAIALLVLRLADDLQRRDALLLGACIGLGWWQTPLTLAVAVPAVAWLLWTKRGALDVLWWAVPTALAGALPWLWWNATHGWGSLEGASDFGTTWWDRFFDLLTRLSVVTGVETPFDATRRVIDNRWLGLGLLAGVLVVATVRTSFEAPGFLLTMVVGYGAIYAANPLAAGVGEDPRYTYLMVPIVAVAIGAVLPDPSTDPRRFAIGLGVVALAVGTTAWGLAGTLDAAERPHPNRFLASPGLEEVVALLDERRVDAAITDTTGAQIAHLSGGRVDAASFAVPRFDDLERAGRRAPRSVYVLEEDLLDNVARLRVALVARGLTFEEHDVGAFRVVFVDGRITPEEAGLHAFGGRLR